jgi:Protein of unknown function (DUF2637)
MNSPLPVSAPAARTTWSRRLVNLLVALVVIAVAAAAFVFSYDGVHAIALLGGMSTQLARYYPGLFDAVLVIACVAAAVLRDGRWWARVWSWLVILVVLAAIGTADVLHAAGYTLRHRPTEAVVAAAPVVAVLLAFSLLLTVLRQSRTREASQPPAPATVPLDLPALPAAVTMPAPIALPAGRPASTADTHEVPSLAAPTREVPALGEPTREMPAQGDGPLLYNPVIVPPADQPGPPDAGDPEAGPHEAAAADDSAAAVQAEPEPVTPPDGLPVMRRSATAPATVIAPVEPPPGAGAAEQEPDVPGAAVEEPAGAAEPVVVTEPVSAAGPAPAEQPEEAPPARPTIRYAGSGALARPGRPVTAEPEPARGAAAPAAGSGDYWDADEGVQYAGLVYAAREERADSGPADDDEAPGPASPRRPAAEPDEDAPPFATAPFATVPRLNRVRSAPEPPAEDEDEEK